VILPFLIVAGVGVGLVMLCKRAQKMAEERARAEAQARVAVERLERQQKEAAERAAAMAAMKARVDAAIEAGAVFVPCVKPVLQQMDLNATPDDTSDDVELLVVYAGYARAPRCPGRLSAHLPREPDALPRGPAQVHLHAWRAHGQRLLPDGAAHQV
jgi:predicted membrane-bound mannosyltransferase